MVLVATISAAIEDTMLIRPEGYRGIAERELLHWGIEITEANIRDEIDRIIERLDTAFGNTDERLGVL